MFYSWLVIILCDSNHIKSCFELNVMFHQIMMGCRYQKVLLSACNKLLRFPKVIIFTRLYLYKHQLIVMLGNDVDFKLSVTPIGGYYAVALRH